MREKMQGSLRKSWPILHSEAITVPYLDWFKEEKLSLLFDFRQLEGRVQSQKETIGDPYVQKTLSGFLALIEFIQ